MTTLEDVQQLQWTYGADWAVRMTHGKARATRRRTSLTDAELHAGMAMTLIDGDGGALPDLLARQAQIEQALQTLPRSTNETVPASVASAETGTLIETPEASTQCRTVGP